VGGGIVADSDPDDEWRELAWKGALLFETFHASRPDSLAEVLL